MLISPVQTKSILYRRVSITPVLDEDGRVKSGVKAAGFNWGGVNFGIETGVGTREDQGDDPLDFIVSLRITINNSEGQECPYLMDVEAVALLHISESLPAKRRDELAEVNGLAIVYGALREMIVGITSRMEYGTLVLPGVNFQDHAKGEVMPEGAQKLVTEVATKTQHEVAKLPSN